METLLLHPIAASYVFPVPGVIPEGMTVEHVDHHKPHNCIGNLMLLDVRIHNALSKASWKYFREHYAEWLEKKVRMTEEVPF